MTGRTQAAQILIFSQIVLYKSCPLKSSRESYVAVMLAKDPVKESPLVVCPTLLNYASAFLNSSPILRREAHWI